MCFVASRSSRSSTSSVSVRRVYCDKSKTQTAARRSLLPTRDTESCVRCRHDNNDATEAVENDSSYESSYSNLSESDASCDGVGVGAAGLRLTAVRHEDDSVHVGDLVWVKATTHRCSFPAVVSGTR